MTNRPNKPPTKPQTEGPNGMPVPESPQGPATGYQPEVPGRLPDPSKSRTTATGPHGQQLEASEDTKEPGDSKRANANPPANAGTAKTQADS